MNYTRIVAISGLAMFGVTVCLAAIDDLTRSVPLFLALFAALFVFYAVSVFALSRLHAPYRPTLIIIFVVAVLCRGAYVWTTPVLSDDIYRYLWEGRVVGEGFNPFELPPDSPRLEHLRTGDYASINHKDVVTIYPPLAQAVFAAAAAVDPGVRGQKVTFALFDLATVVVLALFLRARRMNVNMAAVYGWSPLVVLEFSHSGHMDSLGIFLLVSALYLIERRRAVAGFVSLGLSILAKYIGLILGPFFLFKRRSALWLILVAAVVVVGYVPFAGKSSAGSLLVYGRLWYFNSIPFGALRLAAGADFARVVLFAGVAAYAFYQGYRLKDPLLYTFRVIAVALFLTPTLYPWYVCWIIPFLCFFRNRAWLLFSGLVALSYWVWVGAHAGGEWKVGAGVMAIEYAPFYALLAAGAYRMLRSRRRIAG